MAGIKDIEEASKDLVKTKEFLVFAMEKGWSEEEMYAVAKLTLVLLEEE